MSFQREYAESYDWMKQQFIDWAFTYVNSFLYYEDYDMLNDDARRIMQESMAAFGGNAPTYHIALLLHPVIAFSILPLKAHIDCHGLVCHGHGQRHHNAVILNIPHGLYATDVYKRQVS